MLFREPAWPVTGAQTWLLVSEGQALSAAAAKAAACPQRRLDWKLAEGVKRPAGIAAALCDPEERVIHGQHEAHVTMALKVYCVPRPYVEYDLVGDGQGWT